jgi:hypothetical protein
MSARIYREEEPPEEGHWYVYDFIFAPSRHHPDYPDIYRQAHLHWLATWMPRDGAWIH